jgi:aspartyl-tRNA(Asn)/glutamyl-tRNA(Gln) amidotransferase subunit B
LPKGYQISQYDLPLSVKGWLELPTGKKVRITRAHLEEDTGTLKHGEDAGRCYTLVDFNRSGVPLLEIVSEPDMSSADEGEAYVRALRDILIFAGVSDMRLEEGAGRFDVNVSIRFQENGKTRWPPQSEIKNLNSYQALREAVAFESDRLWEEWRSGGEIRTRKGKITVGWSPERGRTYLQRSKEEVEDYRYFPEPDLVPLSPPPEMIAKLRDALPEMPAERRARFVSDYGLSDYDARLLIADRAVADYYEAAVKAEPGRPKQIANWVMGDLTAALKRESIEIGASRVGAEQLAVLVRLAGAGKVSGPAAKQIFAEMWKNGGDPEAIMNTRGLAQVSDEGAIAAAVEEVIAANAKAVADYKAGNTRILGFLVGQVVKKLSGKANAEVVNRLLSERIA